LGRRGRDEGWAFIVAGTLATLMTGAVVVMLVTS